MHDSLDIGSLASLGFVPRSVNLVALRALRQPCLGVAMLPFVRLILATSLASVALGGALVAQTASGGPADSAKPAAAPAPPPPPPATPKFTGYAEASYAYSNEAESGAIIGRLYDRYSNAFELNSFELIADRPINTAKLDAGVHANVIVGQNATLLHSVGFNPLGPDGDVTQLFVTVNVPTKNGNGIQFKMGRLATFMGVEVIEDEANPVWSEGNQFIYVENFTATGLEVDDKMSNTFTLSVRLDNGWDRIVDTSGHKDVMASLAFTPDTVGTALTIVPYFGAQNDDNSATRKGVDAVFTKRVSKATIWLQGDYGEEDKSADLPDPTKNATWWAVGGWISYPLSGTASFSGRADYTVDEDGARTDNAFFPSLATVFGAGLPYVANTLWSLTGDLNITTFPNVTIRPEVRFDHSSYEVFNGHGSQVSVALSMAYAF
jgi:hypothetical protein